MKLIGSIFLSVWLVLVGLTWGAWLVVDIKLLALLAIVTGVVIFLEALNVLDT